MNMFEALYARQKQEAEDKIYFSSAISQSGRRYSQDFSPQIATIGRGGFGFVRACKAKKGGKEAIVTKVIDRTLVQTWQVDENGDLLEAKILKKLSHPAVVDLIELFSSPSYFLLLMDFCRGEQLWTLVHCNPGGLPQPISCVLFKQVVEAVKYMHEQGVTHNDIKDENIIVEREDLRIKIIDFGSAVEEDGALTRIYCGSETYTSPEVLAGKRFARVPQEIWSLGVLLWVLVYGENPFENVVAAEECKLTFPKRQEAVSEDCKTLLSSILTKEVLARPSISELTSSSWLQQPQPWCHLVPKLSWESNS